MESKNMIGGIVSLAVVVICVAAIMMPVLSDATKTEETFTNEGVFNYGVFEPTDTYTLTFEKSTGTITVNGTTVTPISGVSTTAYGAYSVISTDNVLIRYGSNVSGYYVQLIGNDENNVSTLIGMNNGTATISGGKLVVTNTAIDNTVTTKNFTFTELYAIVPDTDEAVLKASSSEVYIKGDSELYASGLTTVSDWSNMFHFEGTYDDGITITSSNLAEATFDNIEWNIEEVDGYEDLYKLTSIEFDILYNDTTTHATYSYFAVPTEVTAELSQHFGTAEIFLINAIPVLVIVSLVVAAVGMLVVRNRD